MRTVVFEQTGRPEDVLHIRDVAQPTPRWGEVLVRMIASPVNPSDLAYIGGGYGLLPTFPATPGFEGVGVVEANGGGILGWFRKGQRVAVLNDEQRKKLVDIVVTDPPKETRADKGKAGPPEKEKPKGKDVDK